jgi:hypothetical protein
MTQPKTERPVLEIAVNAGTLGERRWTGEEARTVLIPILRKMIRDWPPGPKPRIIKAGTFVEWRVEAIGWHSNLVANADIRITPDADGVYSRGIIEFVIDGKDCGCGNARHVEQYRRGAVA